jgi:hypothetical protein
MGEGDPAGNPWWPLGGAVRLGRAGGEFSFCLLFLTVVGLDPDCSTPLIGQHLSSIALWACISALFVCLFFQEQARNMDAKFEMEWWDY